MNIYFKKDKICTHESLHRIIKTHTRQATKYNINKMILMRYIDIRTRLFSLSIQHIYMHKMRELIKLFRNITLS